MYSERKVRERLAIAEKEYGFRPEMHSVEEVIEFEKHLLHRDMYEFGESGQPVATKNLTEFESKWMLNEQLLCLCDAVYFLTRYAYLRDEEGIIKRFTFRVPQRIYFDIICDLEERDVAIEIMALKARQLGVSLFSELLIAHRIFFSFGVGAVIGSADQTKTGEMSRMMLLCYDMLPVWLRPQFTSRVESDRGKMLFGPLASGVSFQHGSQKFGIATGSTPTVYHLSECALYGDQAKMLIDEGLWKAVHASDRVFGVLESTGRSNKGWWADTWYYSRDNWPRCRMFPMFLPWFVGTDIYPKPAWLRMRPIPAAWRPHRDTRNHVAKAELYVRSQPMLEKHLLAQQAREGAVPSTDGHWHMPQKQQWFWEVGYEEAKAKSAESSFLQEMAGDDDEALQHSEESVFGHVALAEIETRRTKSYEAYTIVGQSIESVHEVSSDYFDYARERILVRHRSQREETYRWELIPLKPIPLRETESDDADGTLFIWHHPTPGISYSIGVDTAAGKGQDSTIISVWTYGSRVAPDVQVAEYASSSVNHAEAFAFVMAIGAYYARFMAAGETKWRMPYLTVEQIEAVGDVCQLQCIKMGWPVKAVHHFTRLDSAPNRIIRQKKSPTKLGWYTNSWSRPILTGNFVQSAVNGWAEINSPWLIEEMRHFEVHETSTGKEKYEHEEGEHDDRIFAAAMAIFCPHDMDTLADRSHKRNVDPGSLPAIDLTPSRGTVISSRSLKESLDASLESVLFIDAQIERYR